ncbi:DNA primase [Sphingomonas ginkgonis]|uniref:DNA primase n=1 Tax=Sphingomonas ginkgonis TaxID=2315330 RepID=A0A429VDW8_9SPHN|nr:DNA primase [Sphingomonas ginkgonis]
MSLTPAFLDELRARTLLSSVIAPKVKLTRAGREWKACCPFHQEKTPSFTINDEKGFYHCFGCGAHGDAIRFLTEAGGLPFMEAVKELAGKAGMDVPAPDPRAREKQERTASLTDVTAAAQRWFAEQLAGIDGAPAREYLKRRAIDAAAVQRFGIGFAPEGRGRLKNALATLGEDRLVETGMLIRPDSGETYDRFRGRLMIPIRDVRKRVIGFGGRIIGEGEPKYLNSPETILFDKGRTLYNIDLASPASRTARRLIAVEGYMDVIALDRAGIAEAVAPNGTAVTEAQLERMWRLDPAPILCFDGDSAGQKAAIRAAARALPFLSAERTLRFVALPPGQDPDDLVRAGGRDAIERLLSAPEPLVDRVWRHEAEAAPLTTPEERAGLRQRLLAHVSAIGDKGLAQLYRDEWMQRFDALVRPQRGGPGRPFERRGRYVKGKGFVPPEPPTLAQTRVIGQRGLQDETLRAVLLGFTLFPAALADHSEALAHLMIADPGQARWRDRLVDAAMDGTLLDREGLRTILEANGTALPTSDERSSVAYTFTREESEPTLALRDLGEAVDTLAREHEVAAALDRATARLQAGDEAAFAEQVRLLRLKRENNERLASLAVSD